MTQGGKTKAVMCVETGRVYESIKLAGARLGIQPQNISIAARGKSKTAGGFHWEYVDPEAEEKTLAKPRSAPTMSITQVQREAERRTRETGRMVRYADIQKEETLLMLRRQAARAQVKQRKGCVANG